MISNRADSWSVCSQIRTTVQPVDSNSWFTNLSRSTFCFSFGTQ